jgi:hypothetical protein
MNKHIQVGGMFKYEQISHFCCLGIYKCRYPLAEDETVCLGVDLEAEAVVEAVEAVKLVPGFVVVISEVKLLLVPDTG